jgi:hypothetical protein
MISTSRTVAAHASGLDGAPDTTHRRLILRSTDDGWALLGQDGEIVFHGIGLPGRQQCLEFARDHGVISVFS